VHSAARSFGSEQGLRLCYILNKTIRHWCYQGERASSRHPLDSSMTRTFLSLFQTLHQSQTMEGCSAPLVVKFADTQKEKDAKRIQSMQSNLWNFAAGINSPLTPSPVPVASPIHSNPPAHTSPYLASEALPATSLQLLQHLQTIGLQQQLLHGEGD
jgi:hypothetical protein